MKHNRRKGFTIIELVIVIAVVAILTAILIPTFMGISEKAGEASNETFVRNINTKLAMNEASTGKKNPTMYDAIKAGREIGFDVEKITPYNNNDIIWDQTNDRFAIVKDGFDLDKAQDKIVYADPSFNRTQDTYKFWKVYDAVPTPTTAQTYSIYARAEKWTATDITVNVGFDAGDCHVVESVSYVNNEGPKKDPVILRTNAGKLTVTAPLDEIKHYQTLNNLDIQKAALASYHEYGQVEAANVKEGHLAFEEGSSIVGLHFEKKEDESAFDPIIVSFADKVDQPKYSRDPVDIPPEGVKVCTLALPAETNNIYLFQDGIYEQIKIQPTTLAQEAGTGSTADKQWVTDSGATEQTQNASDQLANMYGDRASAIGSDITPDYDDASARTLPSAEIDTLVTETGTSKEKAAAKVNVNPEFQDYLDIYSPDEYPDILPNGYGFGMTSDQIVELVNQFGIERFNGGIHGVHFSDPVYDTPTESEQNPAIVNGKLLLENCHTYAVAKGKDNGYADLENGKYQYWRGDFVIKFNKNISAFDPEGDINNTIILTGHYGDWGWLKIPCPIGLPANQEYRLLYDFTGDTISINFEELCTKVRQFQCGAIYINENYDPNDPLTMTIEFRLYEVEDNPSSHNIETGESILIDRFTYTFK